VKYILLYIIIFLTALPLISQEIDKGKSEILLRDDLSFGLNINTRGWGIVMDYSKQKTFKYKYTYGFALGNIKHQKESKILGTSGSKGYYFGKINSVIALRINYGGNYKLYQSKRVNGIEIQYKWRIGPSLALIKPIYLEIDKTLNGSPQHFPERYNPEIHYNGQIYASSSWAKGLGESKLSTGVFVKTGFDFNFSTLRTAISGGEIGIEVDYYPLSNFEIMYNQTGINVFTALYLQFNLGKKF